MLNKYDSSRWFWAMTLVAAAGLSLFAQGCELMETCDPAIDPQCTDNCPTTLNPDQADRDRDGVGDACDGCPDDPTKSEAGTCGCDVSDVDTNGNGTPDCVDPPPIPVTLVVRVLRSGSPAPDGFVAVSLDPPCSFLSNSICANATDSNGVMSCAGLAAGQNVCIYASCCEIGEVESQVLQTTLVDEDGGRMIVTFNIRSYGACCYSDGRCSDSFLTDMDCTGTYLGDGTSCDQDPCPSPGQGACCFPELGTCYLIDQASCGGNYVGDGVPCTTANCPPPPMGACCTTQGCMVTTQAGCDGTYQGDGTTCTPDICQ